MNWAEFQDIFLQKYFPYTQRERLITQFLELRQGDRETLAEYEARFTQLSQYAPHIVADP